MEKKTHLPPSVSFNVYTCHESLLVMSTVCNHAYEHVKHQPISSSMMFFVMGFRLQTTYKGGIFLKYQYLLPDSSNHNTIWVVNQNIASPNFFAGRLTFNSLFQKEVGRKEIRTTICLNGFTMFLVEEVLVSRNWQ